MQHIVNAKFSHFYIRKWLGFWAKTKLIDPISDRDRNVPTYGYCQSCFRYTLKCLVAVNPEASCVQTIQTTEERLAAKKKELEKFQVC